MGTPVLTPSRATDLARRLLGTRQLGQLVRTEPVLAHVRAVGGGTLLDAGSGGLGLAEYLDERWEVVALDRTFADYGAWRRPPRTVARRVEGDVRDMPFPDRSFDVVVALDVVEHLAPADRARAIAELGRVARRRVVVAAPAGEAAQRADERLAASVATPPPWLREHLAHGLPDPEELAAPLRPLGAVRVEGNEGCAAHVTLTRRELSIPWAVPTRTLARVLAFGMRRGAAWPRRVLARVAGGHRPPVYRTVVVCDVTASNSASSAADSAS